MPTEAAKKEGCGNTALCCRVAAKQGTFIWTVQGRMPMEAAMLGKKEGNKQGRMPMEAAMLGKKEGNDFTQSNRSPS